MVMQEGQQQGLYGGGVGGWGGVAAFISAAAGEDVEEGRPNRRPKQKKTPQRGLGVAQLEKIRLEEQQGGAASSAPSFPVPFSSSIPLPPLPLPSAPFSGSSDLNPPATPRSVAIPIPSAPFCDLLVPPAPPPAADPPIASPPAGLAGHGFLPPLLWNPLEMSPEASNKAFGFPISLPEESSSAVWPPSGPFERQHQQWQQQSKQHHHRPSSSVVNPPAAALPFSGVKLRNSEPPSNQSTSMSKPASPLWPTDEKNVLEMAGMKRPWPFHLDAVADYTNLPCKLPLPPLPFPPADEHSPMNGCNLLDLKPGSTSSRDGAPPSAAVFQPEGGTLYGNPPEKRCRERSSAPVYGDFLTLGSSLPTPAPPPPKLNQCPGTLLSTAQYQCLQGSAEDASLRYGGLPRSPEQLLPFYSFLPVRSSNNQETSLTESRHEELGSIDLNLKL